jgi:hypothetical protein
MIQQLRMPEPAPTPRSRKPPQDRPKVRPPGQDPGHPLSDQRLSAGKVAECRGLAVLDRRQQAQGKHGKECRGLQSKIVTNATAKPPHRNRVPVRKTQPSEATRAAMRGGVPWGETPRHPASSLRGRERRLISVDKIPAGITAPIPARRRGHPRPAAPRRAGAAPDGPAPAGPGKRLSA